MLESLVHHFTSCHQDYINRNLQDVISNKNLSKVLIVSELLDKIILIIKQLQSPFQLVTMHIDLSLLNEHSYGVTLEV